MIASWCYYNCRDGSKLRFAVDETSPAAETI